MEFSDKIEMTDTIEIRIEVLNPLYLYFAEQITALNELKETSTFSRSHAVNLMYVPVLTMFIESCVAEVVDEFLFNQKKIQTDSLTGRLIDKLNDLPSKGWKQSRELFKTVFGYDFDKFTDHETLKAIGYLFELRNKLIHGKRLSYSINHLDTNEEQTVWGEHYKRLYEYLTEKNLIEARTDNFITTPLTDKAVTHFLEATIKFTEKVVNYVHEEHNLLLHLPFKAHVIDKLTR